MLRASTTMADRVHNRAARCLLLVLALVAACSAPAAPPSADSGAVAAIEHASPMPAPPARTPPSAAPDPPLATPPPTAAAPAKPAPAITRPPAPVPDVAPITEPFAINLYRDGDFVSQATADWCVPGAILTMVNMVEPRPAGAAEPPGQSGLDRLARSHSTDRLVGAGSEPEGWAGALNQMGYGPYVVRAERTREAAIKVAARALRLTGRPVGLLVWRGAHAWVLSGFEATTDPAAVTDFEVTHVRVQDPWHPRTSSIWGPGQPPNTRIPVAKLSEDFLPWRRPTVRYPEKDGRFVLVLPALPPA